MQYAVGWLIGKKVERRKKPMLMRSLALVSKAASVVLLMGIYVTAPFTSVANALSTKNIAGECRVEYKKWSKRGGYGAFAISRDGSCGWVWDVGSLDEARSLALGRCKKIAKSSRCEVVAELKTLSQSLKDFNKCYEGIGADVREACERSVKAYPQDASANNNLGVYLEKIGDVEGAFKYYKKATNLKAKDKETAELLAENFRRITAELDVRKAYEKKLPDLPNQQLCRSALNSARNNWDTHSAFTREVKEAKRRHLTVDDCRNAIAVKAPESDLVPQNFGSTGLCQRALDDNQMDRWRLDSRNKPFVDEAVRRGMSVNDCRIALSLPAISTDNKSDKKNEPGLKHICEAALNLPRTGWDFMSSAGASSIKEIRALNLTVDDCRVALGMGPPLKSKEPANVTADGPSRRVALVLGNSDYRYAPLLENPQRDAEAMTSLLKSLGFEVLSGINLGKRETEQKISQFSDMASESDVSLFYYAGHGIQVDGINYIVPVDAKVEKVSAKDFELINVGVVTDYMGGDANVGIVLLDACRDNPFVQSLTRALGTRSTQVNSGLSDLRTRGGGLLVGFATAPGDIASDGVGLSHSPFTSALLRHLKTPGLEIELMMKRVKAEVYDTTNGAQQPWHNSALRTEVFLAGE